MPSTTIRRLEKKMNEKNEYKKNTKLIRIERGIVICEQIIVKIFLR